MTEEILARLDASARIHEQIKELAPEIASAVEMCVEALSAGNKLIFFGNGGSAADAQHLACEFIVKYGFERPAMPAIALSTNTSVLTAAANDLGFEQVFSRQIDAVANAGDVVFAISTSGQSPNVLDAVDAARAKGCVIIGLTGARGRKLSYASDLAIEVPSDVAGRIQEAHITIGHVICDLVEAAIHGGSSA